MPEIVARNSSIHATNNYIYMLEIVQYLIQTAWYMPEIVARNSSIHAFNGEI